LVVYGYGPTVGFDLYSTEVVTSVPALEPKLELRATADGTLELLVQGIQAYPGRVLTVRGRGTSEDTWTLLTSIGIVSGQERYTIPPFDTYGVLKVDLYDLTTGQIVAESNVFERAGVSSQQPIVWSRVANGSIQFCRNSAVTPRAMSGAIYDLAGRKVAELPEFQSTSQLCAEWPGLDIRGRSVAAGVYMARFVSKEAGRTKNTVLRIVVRH
jgi:hypothetical protein